MSAAQHQWRPAPLAVVSQRLLELARCWCAELELVTGSLALDDLPTPGRMLLERMAR